MIRNQYPINHHSTSTSTSTTLDSFSSRAESNRAMRAERTIPNSILPPLDHDDDPDHLFHDGDDDDDDSCNHKSESLHFSELLVNDNNSNYSKDININMQKKNSKPSNKTKQQLSNSNIINNETATTIDTSTLGASLNLSTMFGSSLVGTSRDNYQVRGNESLPLIPISHDAYSMDLDDGNASIASCSSLFDFAGPSYQQRQSILLKTERAAWNTNSPTPAALHSSWTPSPSSITMKKGKQQATSLSPKRRRNKNYAAAHDDSAIITDMEESSANGSVSTQRTATATTTTTTKKKAVPKERRERSLPPNLNRGGGRKKPTLSRTDETESAVRQDRKIKQKHATTGRPVRTTKSLNNRRHRSRDGTRELQTAALVSHHDSAVLDVAVLLLEDNNNEQATFQEEEEIQTDNNPPPENDPSKKMTLTINKAVKKVFRLASPKKDPAMVGNKKQQEEEKEEEQPEHSSKEGVDFMASLAAMRGKPMTMPSGQNTFKTIKEKLLISMDPTKKSEPTDENNGMEVQEVVDNTTNMNMMPGDTTTSAGDEDAPNEAAELDSSLSVKKMREQRARQRNLQDTIKSTPRRRHKEDDDMMSIGNRSRRGAVIMDESRRGPRNRDGNNNTDSDGTRRYHRPLKKTESKDDSVIPSPRTAAPNSSKDHQSRTRRRSCSYEPPRSTATTPQGDRLTRSRLILPSNETRAPRRPNDENKANTRLPK